MSNRETTSIWQSIRSLFSPKTIPFLISQGVPRKLFPLGTLLLGMILAFLWAYVISPMVYTSAGPSYLSDSWKKEYVKQVAWQYFGSNGQSDAKTQLMAVGNAKDLVNSMLQELQAGQPPDMVTIAKLQAIQPFAENNPAELGKFNQGLFNGNLTPLLCLVGMAIVVGGVVIFNTISPVSMLLQRKSSAPSTVTEGVEADRRKAAKAALEKAKEAPPPQEQVDRGTPVGRYMSTYIMGDDLYDDSFSIETPSGEFLGETGAGISKTIGVGDPKKVTAVEVWVFDKNDIRTVTKVLMSEHAFKDEAIRAELAPKGEAVQIAPGQSVLLETQTLTIQARIIDLAYGTGALPTNSFFERLSVEISAWPKKASAVPPPMPPAFGDTESM